MLTSVNRAVIVAFFAAVFCMVAVAQTADTASDAAAPREILAVAGFDAADNIDARDTWIPTAVCEALAWRLRRAPGVTVIPTMRVHQGRQELSEKPGDTVEVLRAVRMLGATRWLHGRCSGTPDAVVIELELSGTQEGAGAARQAKVGPARLFDAIDQATRWALRELGVERLDADLEKLILGAPAKSPSALEYHAKALESARAGNVRDALYHIQNAMTYDQDYPPTLFVVAKLEMQAGPRTRELARVHLRHLREVAARTGDKLSEIEFELNYGLSLVMGRSFDAAQQRFEEALAKSRELGDPYGELAALNALCDLALSWEVPPAKKATEGEAAAESQPTFRETKLREAIEWEVAALEKLRTLGDCVAEAPAANKLALIYEQLGEDEWALKMHKWTVSAARKLGSKRSEATGWLFLAQCYREQERWDEALDATARCLDLVEAGVRPRVLMLRAEIQRGMKQPAEALKTYETAYAALKSGDDLVSQFRCLRGLAELQDETGNRKAAIKSITDAIDIAEVLELGEAAELKQKFDEWKSNPQ